MQNPNRFLLLYLWNNNNNNINRVNKKKKKIGILAFSNKNSKSYISISWTYYGIILEHEQFYNKVINENIKGKWELNR